MRLSKSRLLLVTALLVLLAVLAYGFAAQNTVTAAYAGDGTGGVSGYTVTASFELDNNDPTLVKTVNLTLDQNASTVKLALGLSGGTTTSWVNCTGSDTSWSCDVSSLAENDHKVENIISIRVIAIQ